MLGFFLCSEFLARKDLLIESEVLDPCDEEDSFKSELFHGQLLDNIPSSDKAGFDDPLEIERTGSFFPHLYTPGEVELVVSSTVRDILCSLVDIDMPPIRYRKIYNITFDDNYVDFVDSNLDELDYFKKQPHCPDLAQNAPDAFRVKCAWLSGYFSQIPEEILYGDTLEVQREISKYLTPDFFRKYPISYTDGGFLMKKSIVTQIRSFIDEYYIVLVEA